MEKSSNWKRTLQKWVSNLVGQGVLDLFQSSLWGWFAFTVLVFGLSLILSFRLDYLPPNIRVGRIAPKDIKADRNYEIIDERATSSNRQDAFSRVLPVYDYDENVLLGILAKVNDVFESGRKMDLSSNAELIELFKSNFDFTPTEAELTELKRVHFSKELQQQLATILTEPMHQGVLSDNSVLNDEKAKAITLRYVKSQAPDNEFTIQDKGRFQSLEKLRSELTLRAKEVSGRKVDGFPLSNLYLLAARLLRYNISYNLTDTELRRAQAAASVRDVLIKVQTGEAIVRGGDRYEPDHIVILEGIRKQKNESSFLIKFVGTALFVSMLLLITFSFSKKYIRKFSPTQQDLYFLGGVLVLLLLSVRLAAALSTGLRDIFPYDVSIQALYYAIPVAAGAMLTRYILNSEIALVFAIVASALTGLFLQADLDLSIYYLLSSIVAAASVGRVERRSSILRAGVNVGTINALMILAIKLITVVSSTDALNVPYVLVNMGLGFLGGLLSAIFVLVLSPITELLFDYVTDIKLLELGNLNHPLLREMIVKAPGTYHHSQLVAVLAEAAAADIGANPLLARVGSYFHDIGKMAKPSYFIENQQNGENRHDRLSPSMSALIIAAHVKDGLEMAREFKLPTRVAEFIPQHQGTKVIGFFYNRAQEQAKERDEKVDEKDYRYPGPRPQSRETGIVLLADGVEAAVRSLSEKSPAKIQGMVQKIINKNFSEAQLDECDMTLKDLHAIAECFVRVLVGIYHQRIEYPDVEDKDKNKNKNNAVITPIRDFMR